jgi:hypothetical protein
MAHLAGRQRYRKCSLAEEKAFMHLGVGGFALLEAARLKAVGFVGVMEEGFGVVDWEGESDAVFRVETRFRDADDVTGVGEKDGGAAFARHDGNRYFERVFAHRRQQSRVK